MTTKALWRSALVVVLSGVTLGGPITAQSGPLLYDNFNDGVINPFLWVNSNVVPDGSFFDEAHGVFTTTTPPGAGLPGGSTNSFGPQISSLCKVRGDFDLQVSYNLRTWPTDNGVRVTFGVVDYDVTPGTVAALERVGLGSVEQYPNLNTREVYAFEDAVPPTEVIDAAEFSGALRLTRAGTTITGLAGTPSGWIPVGTTTAGPAGDARFVINSFTHNQYFGDQTVEVDWDNVIINAGTLVDCPVDRIVTMTKGADLTFTINKSGNKTLPLWITSSLGFDATKLIPDTVRFGALSGPFYTPDKSNAGDVNGDGQKDLKLNFKDVFVDCSTRIVILTGRTVDGLKIGAFARVTTVGCPS